RVTLEANAQVALERASKTVGTVATYVGAPVVADDAHRAGERCAVRATNGPLDHASGIDSHSHARGTVAVGHRDARNDDVRVSVQSDRHVVPARGEWIVRAGQSWRDEDERGGVRESVTA